jgi:hypothetical protein
MHLINGQRIKMQSDFYRSQQSFDKKLAVLDRSAWRSLPTTLQRMQIFDLLFIVVDR